MKFAPRNQIARNSDVIAAVTGVNSQFTATGCLFAAPAFATKNFPTVSSTFFLSMSKASYSILFVIFEQRIQ